MGEFFRYMAGSGYSELESYVGERIVVKYDSPRTRSRDTEISLVLDMEEVRRDLGDAAEYLCGDWWCTATGERLEITGLVKAIDPEEPGKLFLGSDEMGSRKFSLDDLRLMERRIKSKK